MKLIKPNVLGYTQEFAERLYLAVNNANTRVVITNTPGAWPLQLRSKINVDN